MQQLSNFTYEELTIGQSASIERTVTEADIQLFAISSHDLNPIHLDAEYASGHKVGQRIAHGIWVGSLLSALMATKLPGPGVIYLSQELKFKNPAYIGDTLTVTVTVQEKKRRNIVEMDCSVTKQTGVVILKGTANLMAASDKVTLAAPTMPRLLDLI